MSGRESKRESESESDVLTMEEGGGIGVREDSVLIEGS